MLNRDQLGEMLACAQRRVRLLGVVALDADWKVLAKKWASTLAKNLNFEITILCESDNMLFSKSFTYDTDTATTRHSFSELKFIKDRAIVELLKFLEEERISNESKEKVKLEIMHLQIPVSIVQVDDNIYANLWLHESENYFEEITQDHPWQLVLNAYIDTYFGPHGRKYARDPKDEELELFDHDRVPRGIYPRSSFYDTDYSQLVVWGFVFDRQGRLLIHRRSDNAKDNQGLWDKSVGGHVNFQSDVDTSRAITREVIEELFSDEIKRRLSVFSAWSVSDKEMIYMGEWRPNQRKWHPFHEIRAFEHEWAFFRVRDSQQLYSPRTLPSGKERRLRVISDVYLFVAGHGLTDESLGELMNSTFKLVDLADLKNAMDKASRKEDVPGFDETRLIPAFTPDLTNIMTGKLRDILEEFSQHIRRYIK